MAEPRDPQLSQHYRDLEPLEPPVELDQAILGAGRHAAAPRRKRWYYSLAAAAVLVFAVALTLHMERERPDSESAAQDRVSQLRLSRELRGEIKPAEPRAESKPAQVAPPAADTAAPARAAPPQESRVASAPAPTAAPAARARRADESTAAQREASNAQAPAPPAAAEPPIQLRREMAIGPQYAPAPAAARESPEKWLERIAELRSRGRHAEADKELAEFRRGYPNYALSDVMRERVEGR
jgi:hypothetical protein